MIAISMVAATPASALRWGPNGHAVCTYNAATEDLSLPADVAKVMALGSLAPDFFEFDIPAAHAQVADPPIEHDRIIPAERVYRDLQRREFVDSFNWHEFYFNAAVTAMQHQQRERAAFLLGYALHNIEDLGVHQGMPNLVHAALDAGQISPDYDKRRYELAYSAASLDMAAFRQSIGDENWELFRGQAVRRPSGETVVPSPMPVLTGDLDHWNPASGVMPGVPDDPALQDPKIALFEALYLKALAAYQSGRDTDVLLARLHNFFAGLLQREAKMRSLLEIAHLGIRRRNGIDPVAPEAKNDVAMSKYIEDAYNFLFTTPKQFWRLSPDDRALLASTNWFDVAGENQRMLEYRVADWRARLGAEYEDRINRLGVIALREEQTLRWIAWERMRYNQYYADWEKHRGFIFSLRVPTVDLRPPPAPAYTSAPSGSTSGGSSGGSVERYERSSSRDRSSGSFNFHSPTYNQLRSGNFRW
jgi:hypothetical protein